MNCCNDFGHCTRGDHCPARGPAMQLAGAAHIDMTGLDMGEMHQVRATQPDTQDAASDVQPDYMTPWEWIADIGRIAVAAAAAVAITAIGMGFIYGRWVL